MDELYEHAREQFLAAVRVMATSPYDIQARLVEAYITIREVTLDEFEGDTELRLNLARILDYLAVDAGDVDEEVVENTHRMSDSEAVKIANLIFDFHYELG
jgi:hypothetical protein